MKRRSKLKRIIVLNRELFMYILIAFIVFGYLIINIIPIRTAFVEEEKHSFEEEGKVYVFRDEEYVVINSYEKINFIVDEGTKISASTLLSDNYTISTNRYLEEKIEVIDFMLDNYGIEAEDINRKIYDAQNKIEELTLQLDEAMANSDGNSSKEYSDEIEELQHDISVMDKALQYEFTSYEELENLKNECRSMLGRTDIPLTAGNLGFSVFGSVYYSIDGYENTMNFDRLYNVDTTFLQKADKLFPSIVSGDNRYFVKSTSDNRVVLVIRLPADAVLSGEEACERIYDSVMNDYDMKSEGGYFKFIFKRIDILNIFPAINLTTPDGTVLDGELVKVEKTENEKLLYMALRSNVAAIAGERIFIGKVCTQTQNCYVLNKSCIYEKDGRKYVTRINNGSNSEQVEVKVFCIEGSKAYLIADENEKLSYGDEIKLKGE